MSKKLIHFSGNHPLDNLNSNNQSVAKKDVETLGMKRPPQPKEPNAHELDMKAFIELKKKRSARVRAEVPAGTAIIDGHFLSTND